jgi:hypothetical protein
MGFEYVIRLSKTEQLVPCLINSVPSNGKIKLQLCA